MIIRLIILNEGCYLLLRKMYIYTVYFRSVCANNVKIHINIYHEN